MIVAEGFSAEFWWWNTMSGTFADTLYEIFNVKTEVLMFALVLTGFGAMFIKSATDSSGFAALFIPALAFGCLVGVYGCKMVGLVVSSSKDSNVIATAGIGMVLAFVVMLGFVRIGGILRDITRPINLDGRTQETE